MIALVLMINSGKMLRHNVLVRKPIGIETAGSLNILFSDKTGTITKGKLEVVEFLTGSGEAIGITGFQQSESIKKLVNLAIGKNTSAMYDVEHNVIGGNATDQALMAFLSERVYLELKDDTGLVIDQQQGFNSANKFSQSHISSLNKTFYKGAPERLLAKAKRYLSSDGEVKDIDLDTVNSAIDSLATKAMRVLAFGYSERPLTDDNINEDIVILGFVGIRDDVRPEAVNAIAEVQGAGVQVVMITGDRKETAIAIAKDAGLIKDGELALTSAELNQMSDEEIKAKMSLIRVIARALPTDKSRMVKLCQELNLVTGMTGDGRHLCPVLQ